MVGRHLGKEFYMKRRTITLSELPNYGESKNAITVLIPRGHGKEIYECLLSKGWVRPPSHFPAVDFLDGEPKFLHFHPKHLGWDRFENVEESDMDFELIVEENQEVEVRKYITEGDLPKANHLISWLSNKGHKSNTILQIVVEDNAKELYSSLRKLGWKGIVEGEAHPFQHSVFLNSDMVSKLSTSTTKEFDAYYWFIVGEKKRTIQLAQIPAYSEVASGQAERLSIVIEPHNHVILVKHLKACGWKWVDGGELEIGEERLGISCDKTLFLEEDGIRWQSSIASMSCYVGIGENIPTDVINVNVAQKEKKMDFMSELKGLAPDVKEGAKMASGGEAAEFIVKKAHEAIGDNKYSKILKDPKFFHVQAAVISAGVKIITGVFPNIPYAKEARGIAQKVFSFETALTLKPYMVKITEFVEQLGKSGAHLIEESPDE